MNRRELIKAAGGIVIANKTALLGFDFKPRAEYVVFFDRKLMGKDFPYEVQGFPPNTVFYSSMYLPARLWTIFEESREK